MNAPEDVLEVFLQPGEFYFGEEKTRIRTLLGSCVAITLWHPTLKIGGMCHYMLPQRPRRKGWETEPLDGRYAEDAMKLFQREVRKARTRPSDYQVKLFGGGYMFRFASSGERRPTIADANVDFARATLPRCGMRLAAEDLGGRGHRNVILDVWSGDVWVRQNEPPAVRARARG